MNSLLYEDVLLSHQTYDCLGYGVYRVIYVRETYRELVKVGGYGETMDQIVRKCVEAYKREMAGKQKK